MAADARAWAEEHGTALIGSPADRASRSAKEAGLRPRVVGPHQAVTLEYRPDRVTFLTDAGGAVVEVRAG